MRRKTLTEKEQLTEKEVLILQQLVQGFDNAEIAYKFTISPHTVKTHVANIIKKFDAKNRTHVAFIAGASGMVNVK